ncbi:hypothetical protein BDAP_001223 [Binucleata daphniae]
MLTDLSAILTNLEKLPQKSEIQKDILNLPKTNKNLNTQIYIQILRICAPKQVISTRNLIYCFTNIHSLPYTDFIKNIKIVAECKLVLLLSFDIFKKFVYECFCYKKKLSFENNTIETDKTIDKHVFDIVMLYFKENEKSKKELFVFLISNKKFTVVKNLLNDDIFVTFINKIENDKDFVDTLQILNNEQKNKLKIRTINNKTLLKKYIELLTSKNMVKNNVKRYKTSKEQVNIGFVEDNASTIQNGCIDNNTSSNNEKKNIECVKDDANKIKNESIDNKKNTNNEKVMKYENELNNDYNTVNCKTYQNIYDEYKNNAFVKLMLCFERDCCTKCVKILESLKIDDDSKIRSKANKYGSFEEERILDASVNVRNVIFDRIITEKLFNDSVLLLLFAGLKTSVKDEYFTVLNKIKIDFHFLVTNLNEEMRMYLKQKLKMHKKGEEEGVYNNITNVDYEKIRNTNEKLLLCEYFIEYKMKECDLIDTIVCEPFCGYLYLKCRSICENQYLILLHDNMHKIQANEDFVRVVYFLKDYINKNKKVIEDNMLTNNNEDYLMIKNNEDTTNDNLVTPICVSNTQDDKQKLSDDHRLTEIQTHIYNSIFDKLTVTNLEHFTKKSDNNFYMVFCIAKHIKVSTNIMKIVQDYVNTETDSTKMLQIICKTEDLQFLIDNIDKIIYHKLKKLPQYMIENVNAISLLVFFILGYTTEFYKASIVKKVLYTLSKGFCNNFDCYKDTVKNLLKTYINSLSDNDKCKLLNLCEDIKHYTINTEEFEYKINKGKITKESVPKDDYTLYYLADYIKEEVKNKSAKYNSDCNVSNFLSDLFKSVDAKYQPYIVAQDFTKL